MLVKLSQDKTLHNPMEFSHRGKLKQTLGFGIKKYSYVVAKASPVNVFFLKYLTVHFQPVPPADSNPCSWLTEMEPSTAVAVFALRVKYCAF